jgi:hypothetical protein
MRAQPLVQRPELFHHPPDRSPRHVGVLAAFRRFLLGPADFSGVIGPR